MTVGYLKEQLDNYPDDEQLCEYEVVGFNCRRYDNNIMYPRLMEYDNEQLGSAYNLSYTDAYDFCSKKQSLKKWEIELGISHQELGLPWDQPVQG